VLPAANQHEPTAPDGIADDAVVLLGANVGQAGVAGNDPSATALQDGRLVTDGLSSAVVAPREIRLGGRPARDGASLTDTDPDDLHGRPAALARRKGVPVAVQDEEGVALVMRTLSWQRERFGDQCEHCQG
jgi:hypothetical protein